MNFDIFDLKNKTALITGASGGLGSEFAKCLSDAGVRVILIGRDILKLEKMTSEIRNKILLEVDLSDRKSINDKFKKLENDGERIDICINCSGNFLMTPIFDLEESDNFEKTIQVNLTGMWHVIKFIANHMKNYSIKGSIINIGSNLGANKFRGNITAYACSKAAVIHMTKTLVSELSPFNIRINSISPGLIHTSMTDFKLNTAELRKKSEDTIPLNFIANPDDLNGLILYLSSNKLSRYITGSDTVIDGGASCSG